MYVCICNKITASDIQRFVDAGYSLVHIQQETGLGNKCGKCLGAVQNIVKGEQADLKFKETLSGVARTLDNAVKPPTKTLKHLLCRR